MLRPVNVFSSVSGTSQRSFGWRMMTCLIICPSICGAMPRQVVSTSGNSGIGKDQALVGATEFSMDVVVNFWVFLHMAGGIIKGALVDAKLFTKCLR